MDGVGGSDWKSGPAMFWLEVVDLVVNGEGGRGVETRFKRASRVSMRDRGGPSDVFGCDMTMDVNVGTLARMWRCDLPARDWPVSLFTFCELVIYLSSVQIGRYSVQVDV